VWAKSYIFSLLAIFSLVLAGCATTKKTEKPLAIEAQNPPPTQKTIPPLKPVFKKIDPLENKTISLSVYQEDFRALLQIIAQEAGLDLVIQPEVLKVISPEERLVTVEFHELSLKEALKALLRSLGLGYEVRSGILYVLAYREKIFDLSFLFGLRGTNFNLGGDVLGGQNSFGSNQQETVSPLKGSFELTGATKTEGQDLYQLLEKNLQKLLSKEGQMSLNPLTGILWVHDRVPYLERVERFVSALEKRYRRQVLIEAKILEVNLSRGHELGINWQAILQNDLKDTVYLSSSAGFLWENSEAFILRFRATPYFDSILRAIENYGHLSTVSNPRLRVLHGQPALISVGRSISYIREIDRQITSGDNITTVQTDVETSAVFDGLLFGVTPYISSQGDITLHIVPIKSEVEELRTIEVAQDVTITLPQVNLRETSTVIRVHPNDLVVISGLIMKRNESREQKVPFMGNLPGVGHLFRSQTRNEQKVELVILLRARLI